MRQAQVVHGLGLRTAGIAVAIRVSVESALSITGFQLMA